MNINQQNALIFLSYISYDLVKENQFNSLFGIHTSIENNLLRDYREALDEAFAVFKNELVNLKRDEIMECLENALVKKDIFLAKIDESPAKTAGRLEKLVKKELKRLKEDKPDFILYPAFSRIGLIPKGELSVVEIIDPTEIPLNIEFRPPNALENCFVKIINYHSFSYSKFLSWSNDVIDIFQAFIRVFGVANGYSDARHMLFFSQQETSYGSKGRIYISRNESISNNDYFYFLPSEFHCFLEKIKSVNSVVILDSLMTQFFLDNSLANNVRFALNRFNRAIESHDDCEAIVNLCSSLEAIANELYPEKVCELCESKKVLEGLRGFLNTNAFRRTDLYSLGIKPMVEFNALYSLRSRITHGSLKRSDTDILRGYMPKAFTFVAETIYILLQNAYITGFDCSVPLKKNV
ncbi:hypothetical protein HNW13_018470 [Shewanella sp. BF02_Schw]|uniref:HEPN domain-containing protein n=1 Tax=Shewanella sp. BF02_Schw TaxID=394908 RepID=UPI00177F3844|nr:HEPN domain-containing protein [Shewanella sp. BF02_Schw]MBO1897726.1 hypothetical protein [Shewanella sp. BF02_Schw]